MPGEAMVDLMSDILGTHGYTRGPRATGHMVAPEPSRTRRWVWSLRTRVSTRAVLGRRPSAFLCRGRAWSHEACDDSGAFSCQVTGSVLGARGDIGAFS
jgi:hypothetical protein